MPYQIIPAFPVIIAGQGDISFGASVLDPSRTIRLDVFAHGRSMPIGEPVPLGEPEILLASIVFTTRESLQVLLDVLTLVIQKVDGRMKPEGGEEV